MNKAGIVAAILACALLVGCGKKIDGTYSDPSGVYKYTFSDGKVQISMIGNEVDGTYTLNGNKIDITPTDGNSSMTLELTLNDDGTIGGPMGLVLHKQQ